MTNAEVELKVQQILDRSGNKGIQVDLPRLAMVRAALSTRLVELEATMLGFGFHDNPGSRKQVAAYLFDDQGLLETFKRSVAKTALKHYDHPFLPLHREWSTKKRTLSLMAKIETFLVNGRVTTQWKCTNETSGRIYCTDFNVQQLPQLGRNALIPDPDKKFILVDYKQNELRVLAALSGDKTLIADLEAGDPHKAIYARMYELDIDEVTPEQREEGKTFNYGLIYGMDAMGLARRIDCTQDEAEAKLSLFFVRYPGVAKFTAKIQADAEKTGYIENIFGHRRSDFSDDQAKRLRQYINTLIQGTAASIIKRAMIAVDSEAFFEVIASVHDSILIQVDEVYPTNDITRFFSSELNGVRFPVDYASARSWGEAMERLHS